MSVQQAWHVPFTFHMSGDVIQRIPPHDLWLKPTCENVLRSFVPVSVFSQNQKKIRRNPVLNNFAAETGTTALSFLFVNSIFVIQNSPIALSLFASFFAVEMGTIALSSTLPCP